MKKKLRSFSFFLLVGLVGCTVLPSLQAASSISSSEGSVSFVVIVHPDNPIDVLTREELSHYLLKLKTRWDHGKTVTPVDQKLSDLREAFSQTVHERSMMAVKAEWTKRLFAGRATPPPQLSSDEAVVEYVAKKKGAVGYISADTPREGVKVVPILDEVRD